jgi:ketosteroid isomerase-like protein
MEASMMAFRLPRLLFLLVALLVAGACARPSFDVVAERQKLLRRDAEWADLAATGKDVEKIVSYWSDDAQVIEPGQPVYEGKAAIRAYVTASLQIPGFKIHWVSQNPVFSPDGNMAYMPGVDEMTVPGPNGALITVHTRGISIWRRDPDGEWRCVADIANEPPPITTDRATAS